jgi:hypothetical protein
VFPGVLIAEKVAGVGDQRSGDTTTAHVQSLLDAFLNMPVRSACFIGEAFFW